MASKTVFGDMSPVINEEMCMNWMGRHGFLYILQLLSGYSLHLGLSTLVTDMR